MGEYRTPQKMRLRQITQKIESGAAAGHRLNQASTANTTIPPAAAIAALVATSGAAIQSKVTPTTRRASSCRGPRITDCVRRIDTWELKGLTRIRLQLAIYFCLHRGKFAGKHRKMTSFSSEHKAPAELRLGPRSAIYLRGQL